jgi:hypothetical protein
MAKRPSLAEKMRQAVVLETPEEETPKAKVAERPPLSHEIPLRVVGFYAATRAGKKKVTASLSPQAHKQLRQLGLDQDMTTEALLAEAISDLFKKYGYDAIA